MEDLAGQLTHLPYLIGSAVQAFARAPHRGSGHVTKPAARHNQRRLTSEEVNRLVDCYEAGAPVRVVANRFGINRETVMHHLERRGVPRRANVRKLSDEDVRVAAERYGAGDSMKVLTSHFAVDAKTLRRELLLAGVSMRPPGRPRRR